MLWIISGPTSVGKSTFMMSQRCVELTGLPLGTRIVWPGLSNGLEDADFTDALYHYNILRPLQQRYRMERQARRRGKTAEPRAAEFREDQPWVELIQREGPKQAVVLVAAKHIILDRIKQRSMIEDPDISGRESSNYPNHKWHEVLAPVDLPGLYRTWLQELCRNGIPYILVDSTDDSYRIIDEGHCPREIVSSPARTDEQRPPSGPSEPAPSVYNREEVARMLGARRRGYQQVDLPYGLSVVGKDRSATGDLVFPDSLAGKSVLDVGAAQGYFCFEAEERGAARVVGVDLREERVRDAMLLKDIKSSAVEFMVHDIMREPIAEPFDYVLLLNVVHHLREPLRVIRQLAAITKERLVIEFPTLVDRKFQASLDGDLAPIANALPFIGVSSMRPGIGQTFVFSVAAMRQILLDHEPMFAAVDFIDSPMRGRSIALCHKTVPVHAASAGPRRRPGQRSPRRRQEREPHAVRFG